MTIPVDSKAAVLQILIATAADFLSTYHRKKWQTWQRSLKLLSQATQHMLKLADASQMFPLLFLKMTLLE